VTARVLIVNADDFGLTLGVNRGIQRAHEHGIVTSASLMVRGAGAEDAARYARSRPQLSLGLHVDLAEWVYEEGEWRVRYEVVPADDAALVHAEVDRQVEEFLRLVGRPPTHLDSHQHVHRSGPARDAVLAAGAALNVPVREATEEIRYCGSFYGQDGRGHPVPDAITVDALASVIASLPAGVTELGCHPGDPSDLDNTYGAERAVEVEVLCDERVRAAIDEAGVALASFGEVTPCG
jgi:predicted glycoside hydrolase/deacetylase ChbG (UPF0249 family)